MRKFTLGVQVMPELFSSEWLDNYKKIWNSDEGISKDLSRSGFNSIVAFGIDGEEHPRCVLTISNGEVIAAGQYKGEQANWDLRAKDDDWKYLLNKPPGLMKLGLAYTSRKLKFKTGDYAVMVKDPALSTAFVKCFALMHRAMN